MDGFEENPNVENSRPSVLKYALSERVVKGRNNAAAVHNTAVFAGYIAAGLWIAAGMWTASVFYRAVMNSSALTLLLIIALTCVAIVLTVRAFSYVGHLVSSKKVHSILPDEPLLTRIASDFDVPEDMVLESLGEAVASSSGKGEFVHGTDLIKMKLKTKWDDVRADYVMYLRVRREPASDFTHTLIAP